MGKEFTKVVTRGIYERVKLPNGQSKSNKIGEKNTSWLFGYDEDKKRIYIDRNNEGKKFFKVVEDMFCGYIYKVQKTQILTTKIDRLYKFIEEGFLFDEFWLDRCEDVLETIYNNTKPIKA